jgi:hypothetical protein
VTVRVDQRGQVLDYQFPRPISSLYYSAVARLEN